MATEERDTVVGLILKRRGLVFLSSSGAVSQDQVRTVELELAALGYVPSTRLHERMLKCTLDELVSCQRWVSAALLAAVGANRKHEPLFRCFPERVPDDTVELWWQKVLVHFLQTDRQPCLFCRKTGTTHVLNPCRHVVCDQCFDGANYSACPVCEHHVDQSSPFFQAGGGRGIPSERVTFKLIDLGESLLDETRTLFVSLCERKQALSPSDREALVVIVRERRTTVLSWLPELIPVRENVAIIFGTLAQLCDPSVVLTHAKRYMTTATDVLRFIAVFSGADGSLSRETVFKTIERLEEPSRFWGSIAKLLAAAPPGRRLSQVTVPIHICRFKVGKLKRPVRRSLLGLLESLPADRLVEDMRRHQSYWIWVGEFLHPHEYADRFPNVARAFQIIRKQAPDGTPAPKFSSWYGKLEQAVTSRDTTALLSLLEERPGELARRFDCALRSAKDDANRAQVIEVFSANVPRFATPVLVTLRNHLPTRVEKAGIRIFWPKGAVARGVSSADERTLLQQQDVESAVRVIDAELLKRFSAKPGFDSSLVDAGLREVMAPFNERTASASAVSLPRGSCVPVPSGKLIRMFLHWCQPAVNGSTTDLDLSVALYDESWRYVGVCSYYELKLKAKNGEVIAQSAGDLRDAPWPDGATEFVDLHRDQAVAAGVRYAVMVVNNYAGMPFSLLERGFAGLMLRDDPGGQHFDPRTVELKFSVVGENGVFLPLVLDFQDSVLHWLDVQTKGRLEMNNVETSRSAIAKICPELMMYFASGTRASMYDLGLLHAAARSQRVFVRGATISEFVRRPGEDIVRFHGRLVHGEADEPRSQAPCADGPPMMAFLYRGDIDLPKGSVAYALFRERLVPSLAASDLLS